MCMKSSGLCYRVYAQQVSGVRSDIQPHDLDTGYNLHIPYWAAGLESCFWLQFELPAHEDTGRQVQ